MKCEEEQPEVFGPQIKLDLGIGSSIHVLGEPPVQVVREEHAVEVIRVESFKENPDEEMAKGDMPVHGDVKMGTGDEPVLEDVELGTGDTLVHRVVAGDSFPEDYPGDDFAKVGEINLEETLQTPSEPVLTVPSEETPSSIEPRRKRIKTSAGRTDLP